MKDDTEQVEQSHSFFTWQDFHPDHDTYTLPLPAQKVREINEEEGVMEVFMRKVISEVRFVSVCRLVRS